MFNNERGLGICGLACVLCNQQECVGCHAKLRGQACECPLTKCSLAKCALSQGIDGCYECSEFPCKEKILQGVRIRAFNRYAQMFGKQELINKLKTNYNNGITYHGRDEQKGDYDLLQTENDILRLIHYGSHDPYANCPIIETDNFILRLVREEDADDLLLCYCDPKSQELFNADNCSGNFCFNTIKEMNSCIWFWLKDYENRVYVRFSIVCRATQKVIGTIEMFNKNENLGILRLDIISGYEKYSYLYELLNSCIENFSILLNVNEIVIKAIPAASKRISVLKALGFTALSISETDKEGYWQIRPEH